MKTTKFQILMRLGGLSQREAADYLAVSINTVKKWCNGDRDPAPVKIAELCQLIARQERAADAIGETSVKIRIPDDDAAAQALGWPCLGAWGAWAARVIAADPDKPRAEKKRKLVKTPLDTRN